jgi:hypothetical protein
METQGGPHPARDTGARSVNPLAGSCQSADRTPGTERWLEEPANVSAWPAPFDISESTAVPPRSLKPEGVSDSHHERAAQNGGEVSRVAEGLMTDRDAPVARSNSNALTRVQRDIERARRTTSQASREAHERATQLVERSREAIARAQDLKQRRATRSRDPALTAAAGQPRSA